MQARRASRELTLILFSQLEKNIDKYKPEDFEKIVLKSVRTLISSSQEELNLATSGLLEVSEFIEDYENNHPDNLKRPIEANNMPVQIPLTSDMAGRIKNILSVCDKTLNALEIAEISTLSQKEEVKDYINKIAETFREKKQDIDNIIRELAFGWDLERLFKIDKDILRISIAELVFIKDAPHKVVIDEALELAKKYSTDDSPSFINGILAKVVERYV